MTVPRASVPGPTPDDALPAADAPSPAPGPAAGQRDARGSTGRLELDPDRVGRDLVCLVLTVVELLRQLMERQALHRCDQDDVSDEQIERIGTTLMLLDERMDELCEQHGLTRDELNLDLGPLGTLLER